MLDCCAGSREYTGQNSSSPVSCPDRFLVTASMSGMTRDAIICFRICVPAISTPSRRTFAALIFSSLLPDAHTLLSAVSAISRESSIFSGVTAIVSYSHLIASGLCPDSISMCMSCFSRSVHGACRSSPRSLIHSCSASSIANLFDTLSFGNLSATCSWTIRPRVLSSRCLCAPLPSLIGGSCRIVSMLSALMPWVFFMLSPLPRFHLLSALLRRLRLGMCGHLTGHPGCLPAGA